MLHLSTWNIHWNVIGWIFMWNVTLECDRSDFLVTMTFLCMVCHMQTSCDKWHFFLTYAVSAYICQNSSPKHERMGLGFGVEACPPMIAGHWPPLFLSSVKKRLLFIVPEHTAELSYIYFYAWQIKQLLAALSWKNSPMNTSMLGYHVQTSGYFLLNIVLYTRINFVTVATGIIFLKKLFPYWKVYFCIQNYLVTNNYILPLATDLESGWPLILNFIWLCIGLYGVNLINTHDPLGECQKVDSDIM
jgi:hypothetical protein